MNNNLNFLFGMYEPPQTPLSPTSMRTQFLLSVARNVIPLLSLMTRMMLYIYTVWQWKHLCFNAKFALKKNGLQNYVDAMNWFNY